MHLQKDPRTVASLEQDGECEEYFPQIRNIFRNLEKIEVTLGGRGLYIAEVRKHSFLY